MARSTGVRLRCRPGPWKSRSLKQDRPKHRDLVYFHLLLHRLSEAGFLETGAQPRTGRVRQTMSRGMIGSDKADHLTAQGFGSE